VGKGENTSESVSAPSTHWNYRAVRHPDGTLLIHEVYYESGHPIAMTENGAAVLGETVGELRCVLAMMEQGLAQPILDQASIGQGRTSMTSKSGTTSPTRRGQAVGRPEQAVSPASDPVVDARAVEDAKAYFTSQRRWSASILAESWGDRQDFYRDGNFNIGIGSGPDSEFVDWLRRQG
jgi:hypothetical protein